MNEKITEHSLKFESFCIIINLFSLLKNRAIEKAKQKTVIAAHICAASSAVCIKKRVGTGVSFTENL